MDAYELIDLAINVGSRLDVKMSIFITVHLAIFGGIIYVDRPLRTTEKIVSLIVYTVFAVMNYNGVNNQLIMLLNLSTEIAKYVDDPCCRSNTVILYMTEKLREGQFDSYQRILIGSHVFMYIIVFLSVIFDKALSMKVTGKSK